MDRRSFLRGLAATTAAVPITGLVPVVTGLAPCDLRPGALNFEELSVVLRELAEVQAHMIDQWGVTAEAILPPRLRWR